VARLGTRTIAGLEVEEHVIGSAADSALPVVVSLHGRGGVPELPFGDARRACRVLLPRGPIVLGDGFAWSAAYARGGREDALAADLRDVADRLRAVVTTIGDERGAIGRTIVLGFSQGAMAALALAALHEAIVGDVVVGAAWLPPALEPLEATPSSPRIRIAHGDADDVVPFAWDQSLSDRLRSRGFDVELRRFEGVAHTSSAEMTALTAAWREAAIARAYGEAEPPIPALGALTARPSLWSRLRARFR
jgi:predicted esterase